MRFLFLVVLVSLIFSNSNITAQKHDYHWVLGYDSNPIDLNNGGTNISFLSTPPDTIYVYREMNQGPFNNNISDAEGNLLFYTNGCEIAGADDLPLLNGDSINTGMLFNSYCDSDYPITQGGLILPDFLNQDLYHFFHLHGVINSFGIYADALWYSVIDMKGDGGHGEVVNKNQVILEDTLWLGQLSCTRHANGRDWWLLMPYSTSNKYKRLLFSPNGFSEIHEQDFANSMQPTGTGQAAFSPDGGKYIRFDQKNKLQIFDFDRCSGMLSNPIYLDLEFDPENVSSGGVAVSPNSRYLYITATIHAYQFDLQADNIAESQVTVAQFDGYASPFGSTFYLGLLGPDGKIYFNTTNSENVLHVIHKPDQPGLACEFRQHDFKLPTYNAFSVPNFPNYRLETLIGSDCDTLVSVEMILEESFQLNIYPNPAQDELHLSFDRIPMDNYLFSLTNMNGQIILQDEILQYSNKLKIIDLRQLNNGIYYFQLYANHEVIKSGKFVKME